MNESRNIQIALNEDKRMSHFQTDMKIIDQKVTEWAINEIRS
jgi:hypothetical protein